ncbi:SIP domain-containing protein [Okibacterium endophyticum]
MTIHDQAGAQSPGTLSPTRPSPRRRAARRPAASKVQYLLACDESGLAELEAALSTLPICAKGRVFIEVDSPADIGTVDVPTRMTVTWLTRSTRTGAPGTAERCTNGIALTRAVTAWSNEMLFEADATDAHVWLGGGYRSVSGCFEHLTAALGVDESRITVPSEYCLHGRR